MQKVLSLVLTALWIALQMDKEDRPKTKPLNDFLLANGFEQQDIDDCVENGKVDQGAVSVALLQPERRRQQAELAKQEGGTDPADADPDETTG